jgi:hypothetical protein
MSKPFKDWKGVRVGKLVVVDYAGLSPKKIHLWDCICDCGNTKRTSSNALSQNTTTSCGCKKILSRKFFNRAVETTRMIENAKKATS